MDIMYYRIQVLYQTLGRWISFTTGYKSIIQPWVDGYHVHRIQSYIQPWVDWYHVHRIQSYIQPWVDWYHVHRIHVINPTLGRWISFTTGYKSIIQPWVDGYHVHRIQSYIKPWVDRYHVHRIQSYIRPWVDGYHVLQDTSSISNPGQMDIMYYRIQFHNPTLGRWILCTPEYRPISNPGKMDIMYTEYSSISNLD